ncbi:hypothetical protein Arub01_10960 [Actinomadura rubrobrunea]|uniref:Uncharacterized protein n=1 Tax=Actinomadura rubrobrunea TaxID=115335 RepID=A0A9W6UV32_9ACTN|nr:hypothetical protein Arub01_10960 [Actinomadura rubrobrunea]
MTCGFFGSVLGCRRWCPKLESLGAPGDAACAAPARSTANGDRIRSDPPRRRAARRGPGRDDKDPPTASRMEKRIWHAVPT